MNSFVVVTLFACLVAISNASWVHHHEPSAHILQGPSSKTTLVGPEGSVISAVAPGGQIIHEEHPGVVAHAAPIYAHVAPAVVAHHHHAPSVYSAYHHAPAVSAYHHEAPSATVVAHSSAYSHHGGENVVVAGPSGTISTGHGVHQQHHAPIVAQYAAPSVLAHHSIDNNGYEGQYVHDHSELLYDDGSYKPHVYHH